ncbi:RecX family transcriptional regulator, partial [Serratia quinivorans]
RAMRPPSQRADSEPDPRRQPPPQLSIAKARFGTKTPPSTAPLPEEPVDPPPIEQVIAYCYQHNWLDDQRFARRYIGSRSRKGYGAQRIRSDLMQKGVDKELTQAALADCEIDLGDQAKQVARRKFGDQLPT